MYTYTNTTESASVNFTEYSRGFSKLIELDDKLSLTSSVTVMIVVLSI